MGRLVVLMVRADCTPLPESVMVAGELVAVLTTVTVPLTLPDAAGANTTLKAALCPAASVTGGIRPVVLNPAPETLTWEMLTLELPMLVSLTVCVLLVPTNTLPKLKLVGLAVSWNVAATPVPLRAMAVGEFGALLTSDTLPVTLPVVLGAKVTLKTAD